MSTVLREDRTVLHVDGEQIFQVSVVCSERGTLPDTGIFLYQIVDANNPLTDIFVRIVEIADFESSTAYLANRTAAALRGDTFWRSAVLTKTYDDIETANAAVQAIFDRVNKLVNDYGVYTNEFKATNVAVYFPTTDPSQVDQLKAAYDTAYAAYDAAVAAESAAKDDLTAAQDAAATAQGDLDAWLSAQTKFSVENGNDLQAMTDAANAFASFVSTGAYSAVGFIGAVDAFVLAYRSKFGVAVRKLALATSGYTNCAASDIGKSVEYGSSVHGTLRAFSNDPPTWWVAPLTEADTFPPASVVNVSGGTGAGTVLTSVLVGAGPLDPEVATLESWRNSFNTSKQQALLDVTKAEDGTTHHTSTSNYISSEVAAYTAKLSAAQANVTSKQTAYNQAQGDKQTAYTALQNAYDAVKAVCPNWTPTNPFPPAP